MQSFLGMLLNRLMRLPLTAEIKASFDAMMANLK